MKRSKLFFTSLLAITLGVGAASFGVSKALEAKPVEAAPTTDQVMYISVSGVSWWESDGAGTNVWVYPSGGSGQWATITSMGNGVFSYILPAGCDRMIIARDLDNNMWKNESYEISYEADKNYHRLTAWNDGGNKAEYATGFVKHFTAGDKIYCDIQGNESWWFDGYNTYFHAAVGNLNSWTQMSRVGTSNLLTCTFSGDVYADYCIFVRNTSASWTGKTNQTNPDILFTSANSSSNAFKLGLDDNGSTPCTGMEAFTDAFVADCFGYYFLKQDICLDAGGLSENASTNWSNASSVYTVLKALLINQNYIKTSSSSGDLNINRALLRYDTALAKNPTVLTNDFIGRTSGNGRAASSIIESTNKTSSIITVVIVSIAALTAIGGYFFLRKRKED